jgi:hypothetical protein
LRDRPARDSEDSPRYNETLSEAIFSAEMAMNEHLDAAYEHLPPHIRQVAVKIAQQIALTADPVKTTLEATFTEFLGQILLHVKEWK